MILLQISINKNKDKWLTNSEHEINLFFVKNNLENIYNIEIASGFFYYVLKKENNIIIDNITYTENKEKCLFYDLKKGFSKNIELFNSHSFITNKFLIFNEASLLKNDKNIDSIEKIERMIKSDFKNINDELFETIKNYLKNENDKNEISKEQFHIIGNEDIGNTFIYSLFKCSKKRNK